MNKYFVSVLVLNFNNGRFLNRSIKSCLNQSYKKIEVLVYDDKSTDESKAILKKYKNKKVRVFYNSSNKTNIAAELNIIKTKLLNGINSHETKIELKEIDEKLSSEKIDITLPTKEIKKGKIHPVS